MKLADMTLDSFTEVLASNKPAPGGGSTAALEGALGASLVSMVANFTIGRKKYAEHDDLMKEIAEESERLRLQFVDVIDRDTQAFNGVTAVFAMPKESDEEKAARSAAMQEALKACTLTPFEMMECSLKALELADKMPEKFNTNAASDLGVAVLSLKATVQGAWLNILINIGGIKDEAFVSKYRLEGEVILKKSLPIADKIYAHVLEYIS